MLTRGPRALASGGLKATAIGLVSTGAENLAAGNTVSGVILVVVGAGLLVVDQYFLNRVVISRDTLEQVKSRGIMAAP